MDKFVNITACGGDCTGCEHYISSECEGCNANGGKCIKMWQNGCKICKCCKEHGVQFCGICEEFPCEWLEKTLVWESDGIGRLENLGKAYKESLERAIGRIRLMEYYFDAVSMAFEAGALECEPVRAMISELEEYLNSGLWLSDYEADERGEIPKDLKRGVLSQDGLYDLLSRVK